MELKEFFAQNPKAALAFSGGADSAYLLYAALACGADVRPYCAVTPFQPAFERADAADVCARLGVEPVFVMVDLLTLPTVAENPADRCYACKTAMLAALRSRASEDGYALLLDGTNASDEAGDRPGMRALAENAVLSPLRLCGLTKDEIRRRSREAGLPTADKPAYACLATRIPAGERITEAALRCVEAAEEALRGMGFSDLRVRLYHGAARIQLPAAQLAGAAARAESIRSALRPWFAAVLLDLEGR